MRTRRVVNTTITNQVELTLWAQAELDRLKDPLIRRTVGAIDLSQLQPGAGFTRRVDFMYVGAGVRIKLPPNVLGGAVISTNIVGVTRDLGDPLNVQIEVGDSDYGKDNQTRSDYISDILSNLESLRNDFIFDRANQAVTFLGLGDTPGSYGTEGQIYAVNAATTALEATDRLLIDTSKANLGTPTYATFGEVTGAGNDKGLWYWASDASLNADWLPVPAYAPEAT